MGNQKQSSGEKPLIVQGFTVLQVQGSSRSSICRCLYLKEYNNSKNTSALTQPTGLEQVDGPAHSAISWPVGRTLVVHNVPPYATQDNIRLLFAQCGNIQRMHFVSKQVSKPPEIKKLDLIFKQHNECVNKIVYIVFKKPGAVKNACNLVYDQERLLSNSKTQINAGLRGYIKEYQESVIDMGEMEKRAEEFMDAFNKEKDNETKREKEMEGVPDEDGFIKVTRHGKNKGLKRTEETEKRGHEHIRSRKKKNELKDFYTFQYREEKRKNIADLQAKFEEDKKKVKEMKIARKFRPY